MTKFENDYLKQSIISTINLMLEKIGENKFEFDFLFRKDYKDLEILRDETLVKYNNFISSKN